MFFRVEMDRHARHRIPVHLENVEIVHLALDFSPRPRQQLIVFDPGLDQAVDLAYVFFLSPADGLVFVGVHKCTDALVGKNLGQQAFLDPAVDNVHAGHAASSRPHRLLQLGHCRRIHFVALFLENVLGLFNR